MEEWTSLTVEEGRKFLLGTERWTMRKDVEKLVKCEDHKSVLDVGCGPGMDTAKYSPDSYVGIDVSESLLAVAVERHPDHVFDLVDVTKPPTMFMDKAFDVAFSISVIEHHGSIAAARAMLREMLRVAKRVVIGWNTRPWNRQTQIIRFKKEGQFNRIGFTNWYNKDELLEGIDCEIVDEKILPWGKGRCATWHVR